MKADVSGSVSIVALPEAAEKVSAPVSADPERSLPLSLPLPLPTVRLRDLSLSCLSWLLAPPRGVSPNRFRAISDLGAPKHDIEGID